MIALIFVGLAIVIGFIQVKLAPTVLQNLFCEYKFDMKLAEPGEVITCRNKLLNAWRFPVAYINYIIHLPEGAEIVNGKGKAERHRLFLMPEQKFENDIRFTLPKRGVYKSGKYYLETGDFLGFNSKVVSEDLKADIVIVPEKSQNEHIIKTLGGYIGDISVRRFIIEDPVLTVGFREYTGKEPMKNISWNQSARRNELMVKNNDYTTDTNVAVVLNMQGNDKEKLEECFRISRTVCEQLEEKRIPYEFICNGDVGNCNEGYGRNHLNYIMKRLGRSNLFSYYSFDELIDRCIEKRKNNRSYIVITSGSSKNEMSCLNRLQAASNQEICVLQAGGNDNG